MLQTFQESRVTSVAFAPDGKTILTGSSDNTAKLWSIDGRLLQTFRERVSIFSVAFAPDGKSLLTNGGINSFSGRGRGNSIAKLWSTDSRLLQTFQNPKNSIISVAVSPDGKSILAGSRYERNVSMIKIKQYSKSILTSVTDSNLNLWSIDGRLLQTFQRYRSDVNSVTFAPDGKSILIGSGDLIGGGEKAAKLWSIDGRLLQTFQSENQRPVDKIAFAPDGKAILTVSGDEAKLWSIDGRLLQTFQGHQDSVDNVAFAPDGKTILTGSRDNTAKLWSIDGRLQTTFQGHQDTIFSVAFAPDGKTILTGSRDNTAKLWSIDGRLQTTFQGHQDYVTNVAFAPDGKTILTGSKDDTAKLWSLDGRLLHTFQERQDQERQDQERQDQERQEERERRNPQYTVSSLAFTPDGKSILTGNTDGLITLWDLNLDHSLSAICEHLRDFASLSNDRTIPEEDRKLRQRAKTACEGIPPPKTSFNFLKNGNLTLLSSIFIGKRD
ncbi:high-affnity carbon uptake protein Hat/HatR [Pseudanabaena sp. lw0831]|nr:high-affnity carbon uptake protein Hat/HatR [Pseudanabaena sp. lw0831]